MEQLEVTYPDLENVARRAVLTIPDGTAHNLPGVVILHEIFGVRENMKAIARRFAEAGYASILPDLFDGGGPMPLCVMRAARSYRKRHGPEFERIQAARAYLSARPEVDGERIGVAGFCFGGGFAILVAAGGDFRVAAPFYGRVPESAEVLAGSCPVVASFGGRDGTLPEAGPKLAALLRTTDVAFDIKVYAGAGHAFMTPKESTIAKVMSHLPPMHARYDPTAADDAWQRTLSFFRRHLG